METTEAEERLIDNPIKMSSHNILAEEPVAIDQIRTQSFSNAQMAASARPKALGS